MTTNARSATLTLCLIALVLAASAPRAADQGYRAEIEKFHQERDARLKADDGWLTIAGLYFLIEGESTFGSDQLNDIVLPAPAPLRAGTFELRNRTVTVKAAKGTTLTINGKPVASAELKTDGPGTPDRIAFGSTLLLWVHESGDRRSIRVRDQNNRLRKEFSGAKWFPINESLRVEGRFVPYDKPKKVQVPNILGDLETYESPGLVTVTIGGQQLMMEPIPSSGGKRFWFVFRDLTSGKETYPSARFLYVPAPMNGKVVLDFNQAENPPCAYNPFTTCPLPPERNRLRVRVEAGEKIYAAH